MSKNLRYLKRSNAHSIVLIHLRPPPIVLLEVTKATIKKIAGEITVAHTTADIDRYSVTSVYEVGIDLGLIDSENDMVYFYYSTFES